MTTKKAFIWVLASLCSLIIISSCNGGADREKLSQALSKYDSFSDFSDGFAEVRKGEKYGLIDKLGNEIVPCEYNGITTWNHIGGPIYGKQAVLLPNGKVMELNGYSFTEEVQNTNEIAAVAKGGEGSMGTDAKWGFIDKTGKEIIPCIYELPITDCCLECSISEGLIRVGGIYEKYGFIDKTGKEVIPLILNYGSVGDFSDGMAFVGSYNEREYGWRYGFIDKTGKEVIPCIYENASPFSEGLACVQKNGKYGFIDKDGKEAISFNYNMTSEGDDEKVFTCFKNGLAIMRVNDGDGNGSWMAEYAEGTCGVIDKSGKVIIPFTYSFIYSYDNKLFICYNNYGEEDMQKCGVIDKSGKVIIPFIYSSIHSNDNELFGCYENYYSDDKQKCGIFDKTGKEVIPVMYNNIERSEDNYFIVSLNRKYGIIDNSGKEIIPCVLEESSDYHRVYFSDGLALIKWNNQKGYVDKEGYFIGKGIVEKITR